MFWKWVVITAVKVFAYSANIGWRSLRGVCGLSYRCTLEPQRAQNSLHGDEKVCMQTRIYKWLLSPWLLSSWPRKVEYSWGQCPVSCARRGMDINAAFSLTEKTKLQSLHPRKIVTDLVCQIWNKLWLILKTTQVDFSSKTFGKNEFAWFEIIVKIYLSNWTWIWR